MKKLLFSIVLFASFNVFGAIVGVPFIPQQDARFDAIEQDMAAAQSDITTIQALPAAHAYTTDGISNVRIARATYDVAVNLGTIAPHLLGVSLPAKAIIKQSWFYIDTQFVDAGSGTVAISCEDANNVLTASDITGITAGTITTGASTGSAATMVGGIAAACELTATVATAAQTSGKLTVFVEYVISN